jgi:erythromycin esterase
MAAMGRLADASVIPLSTIDPAAPLDDLEPLTRLIGAGVRVVAVGESVHGAHEFYALRHRLARFLVERLNFTALAWESGFPEGFLVDDYLHGRRADRDRVLRDGMTMHMGRCEEMATLVDWLRGHNAAGRGPVHFYGLDLPATGGSLGPALDVVAPYVESADPGFHSRLARLRDLARAFGPTAPPDDSEKITLAGTAAIYQYVALPVADRNELTALLADLAARFDALRRTYVERSDAGRYDVARQHLRMRVLDQAIDIDVRRAFDMLIHVPRISLWTSPVNASLTDTRTGGARP